MVHEVQTLDARGVPASEYLYQPEHLTDLEERYAPNMKLVHQGEQDKLNRVPPFLQVLSTSEATKLLVHTTLLRYRITPQNGVTS